VPPPEQGSRGARALREILKVGVAEFADINGQELDRVSGVRPSDDGWSVLIDVVDLERIPSTTSILSTYRVDLDSRGHLLSYERLRRFVRSSTES